MITRKLVFSLIFESIYILVLTVPIFALGIWAIPQPTVPIEMKLLAIALFIVIITGYVYLIVTDVRKVRFNQKMNLIGIQFDEYNLENKLKIAEVLHLPHGYKKNGKSDFIPLDLHKGCSKALICNKATVQPFPERYIIYETGELNHFSVVIDEYRNDCLILTSDGPGYQTSP